MRRTFIGVSVALTAVVALTPRVATAQTVPTEEPSVSWGVDVAASSAYLWRGLTDIDEPSLQPSIWVGLGPLTVNAWFSGPDPDSGMRLREQDLTIEYEHTIGPATVAMGWTHYYMRYATDDRHANELFVRISREGTLTPAIEIARGLTPAGTTVVPSLEGRMEVSPQLRVVGLLSAGYNHHQWIDGSLFTHVEGRGGLEWQANDRVTMRPFIGWSRSLNESVLPSRMFGGLELSLQGRP